jgi:AcrR family transcriptional regulator
MRRLAERCGVGAMTLYGYVSTKEELLGALADRFVEAVELPTGTGLTWEEQVKGVFRSVHRVFLEHPDLADVVARQHTNAIAAYRGAEVTLGALRRAGLSDEDAVSTFVVLTAFTAGYAQRQAHSDTRSAQQAERLMTIRDLPADEFGHVAEMASLLIARDSDRHFEVGLDLLVGGIASRAA